MDKNDMNGSHIWAQDLVEFNYTGGSNPGSKRVVLVLTDNSKNFTAWDFTKEELRTFNRDKVNNVRFLEDEEYKEFDLSNLPSKFDAKEICASYVDDGYKCFLDKNNTITAVKIGKPKKISPLLDGYRNIRSIGFMLGDKWIRLSINDNGNRYGKQTVELYVDGEVISEAATVADLLEVLCP